MWENVTEKNENNETTSRMDMRKRRRNPAMNIKIGQQHFKESSQLYPSFFAQLISLHPSIKAFPFIISLGFQREDSLGSSFVIQGHKSEKCTTCSDTLFWNSTQTMQEETEHNNYHQQFISKSTCILVNSLRHGVWILMVIRIYFKDFTSFPLYF